MSSTSRSIKSGGKSAAKSDKSASSTLPSYRLLAPKSIEPSSIPAGQVTPTGSKQQDRCRVCFKRNCKLFSHNTYTKLLSTSSSPTTKSPSTIRSSNFSASYAYKLAYHYVDRSLDASKTDPFHDLPLPPELQSSTTQMHELFHFWFTSGATRHYDRHRPREIANDLLHGPFVAPGLNDTVLCLSILSISASTRAVLAVPDHNLLALRLIDLSTRKMMQRIGSDTGSVSDNTIAASAYLWASSTYMGFDNDAGLQSHGESVWKMVDSRDGVAQLGMCGAVANLLKWVDITTSLISRLPCRFRQNVVAPVLPPTQHQQHEQAWSALLATGEVGCDIIGICQKTCEAITFVDESMLKGMTPTNYILLRQMVTQQVTESSIVMARYVDTTKMEECVGLATMLVSVIVCGGCELPSQSTVLARYNATLVDVLQKTFDLGIWSRNLDTFIWILFVCSLTIRAKSAQDWCQEALKRAVEYRFGSQRTWSRHWREQLATILHSHGWSNEYLRTHLDNICRSVWPDLASSFTADQGRD